MVEYPLQVRREIVALYRMQHRFCDLGGHKASIEWLMRAKADHKRLNTETTSVELVKAREAVRSRCDRYANRSWIDRQAFR